VAADSPIVVYYGLLRIVEIVNLGVHLGAAIVLNQDIKTGYPAYKQDTPQGENNAVN
jgi:hypothetical protein